MHCAGLRASVFRAKFSEHGWVRLFRLNSFRVAFKGKLEGNHFFPTRQEGVVRCYVGIRVCDHAPTQYPARAARQRIPPSIPPELLASGSRPVSRQSCSPVDPAKYPARAACEWIPLSIPPERLGSGSLSGLPVESIPPERLASGSRRVFRQSCSPVDPAQYPARAARQWILPSILPERVDPAKYPARAARQWIQRSIPPEQYPAEYPRVACKWIPPSIPPASGSCRVSHQSSLPVDPAKYLAETQSSSWIPLSIPPE